MRLLLLGLLTLTGCDGAQLPDNVQGSDDNSYQLDRFRIVVTNRQLKISRQDGTPLLVTPTIGVKPDSPALAYRNAEAEVIFAIGSFLFNEQAPPWTESLSVRVTSADETGIVLEAGGIRGEIRAHSPGVLQISWSVENHAANRLFQSFHCPTDEKFYGTGARVHGTQHRGETIPNWVSEQGVGKVRKVNPSQGFPLIGDIHETYLPVPFALSSRGYGVLVKNSQRSLFRFCTTDSPEHWSIEVWDKTLSYYLIDGPKPLDVVTRLTTISGRPKMLPRWAFAPWFDALHGPDEVRRVAQLVRDSGIPGSVIWTEDWIGGVTNPWGYHLTYQWTADTSLYPDLRGLTDELHSQGFKFLVYFNSFIEEGLAQWDQALADKHVIVDDNGDPVIFDGVFFQSTTLPDLTAPRTVEWLKSFFEAALDLGVDGWMADYAEWLPTNTRLADGRSGLDVHNLYPILWQKANREALEKKRPNGDYLFFARSGWTGTGKWAPVVWAGDQQTEFGGLDGIQTVLPLILSAGLSGIPVMTHDIGGYSSVGVPPATRELYWRWAALGAWSSIMRTHHGSVDQKNWQWNEDAETIAMFREHAITHIRLFPYRYSIAREASELGWPMMRHLILHYPDDPEVADISDQFLLGKAILVAPVLEQDARERAVYLPPGLWYYFFNGRLFHGGMRHQVPAQLKEIPVFVAAGSLIPMLPHAPDTLAPSTVAGILDGRDIDKSLMELRVYLGQNGSFRMYDDTIFSLKFGSNPGAQTRITVNGRQLGSCTANERDCVSNDGNRRLRIRLSSGKRASVAATESGAIQFVISIDGRVERPLDLLVQW